MDGMKKEYRVPKQLLYRADIHATSGSGDLRKTFLGTDVAIEMKSHIFNPIHLFNPHLSLSVVRHYNSGTGPVL
jgi:hypothetical protein